MNKQWIFFLMVVCAASVSLPTLTRSKRKNRRRKNANNVELQKEVATEKIDSFPRIGELSSKIIETQSKEDALRDEQLLAEEQKLADEVLSDEINTVLANDIIAEAEADAINEEDEERIEFQFENTDLFNVIQQVADIYNITIITDDILDPTPPAGKTKGFKISFRTNEPMTKKAAWNLFTSFLDIARFSIIPDKVPERWRVVSLDKALTSAVPSYIGVDASVLPDSEEIVRYVYFVENSEVDTLAKVVTNLKSASGQCWVLNDLKGLIIVDRAYNIKVLMRIVKELDKVSMPQAMSVLKLNRIDAKDVADLYDDIIGGDKNRMPTYPGQRKQSSALYFPENTRVIAETRTNSLILLGTPEGIAKVEAFVKDNLDKEPERPYSPLYYIDVLFADAQTLADIITKAVTFGAGTTAAKVGGVRGTDRYFKPSFKCIPDTSSNRLIIRGDYEEYLVVEELVKKLDRAPQQVAIEVLIVTVDLGDKKAIGSQLRNKACAAWNSVMGQHVNFQTSGFDRKGIQTVDKSGSESLLANLVDLAKGLGAGNTVLTLGSDIIGGVWGIMRVLESFTNTQVVSNPFVMACNKQPAKISVGEIRRVTSAIVQGSGGPTEAKTDDDATLTVKITPQINSDGKILLDLDISIREFTSAASEDVQKKSTRSVKTLTMVSDKEVLALGGLIQNRKNDIATKVPMLGDVPLIGWLFKNKGQDLTRNNLLILISTSLIEPEDIAEKESFTRRHVDDYLRTVAEQEGSSRDPFNKWFFEEHAKSAGKRTEAFIFKKPKKRQKKILESANALLPDTKNTPTSNKEVPVKSTNNVATNSTAATPAHRNKRISLLACSENDSREVTA